MLWIAIVITVAVVALVVVFRSGDDRVSMPLTGQRATETIESLVADGRKIEAIKLYRQQHGVGLKEAKDAVELMERSGPTPVSP
jgi:ribosomal protein L7/L12